MQAPRRWERKAESLRERVMELDRALAQTIGFLLAALHDEEDVCAEVMFASEKVLRVKGLWVDADLAEALEKRFGDGVVRRAVSWLQADLHGGDPAWAAWLLHRVKVEGNLGMQEIVNSDGIVYDIEKRALTKKKRGGR